MYRKCTGQLVIILHNFTTSAQEQFSKSFAMSSFIFIKASLFETFSRYPYTVRTYVQNVRLYGYVRVMYGNLELFIIVAHTRIAMYRPC